MCSDLMQIVAVMYLRFGKVEEKSEVRGAANTITKDITKGMVYIDYLCPVVVDAVTFRIRREMLERTHKTMDNAADLV